MTLWLGTVSEEARLFVWSAWASPLSHVEYDVVLDVVFPAVAKEVLSTYPDNRIDCWGS